jgi:hypothetical protein
MAMLRNDIWKWAFWKVFIAATCHQILAGH